MRTPTKPKSRPAFELTNVNWDQRYDRTMGRLQSAGWLMSIGVYSAPYICFSLAITVGAHEVQRRLFIGSSYTGKTEFHGSVQVSSKHGYTVPFVDIAPCADIAAVYREVGKVARDIEALIEQGIPSEQLEAAVWQMSQQARNAA